MRRITISLSSKSEDAATVIAALETVCHWKRSAELVRWAAAYLNGESLAREDTRDVGLNEADIDAALDAW